MAYSADTKLGELLDVPAAKELLVKFMPDLANAGGPMLSMGRGMSLKTISGFPQAKLSAEKLQELVAALQKL